MSEVVYRNVKYSLDEAVAQVLADNGIDAHQIVQDGIDGYVDSLDTKNMPLTLNEWAALCRKDNDRWWHDLVTGEKLTRNKGELLMLIVSEVSEAMEGERKNLMDDKLPHRRMAEVELADALIRIFDYAGEYGYDLEGAVREKRAFNRVRVDHTAEARMKAGGKQW